MYDARQFTMAEIAASCGVTPMTIYRNIRTGQPTATEITNSPPEATGNNQDHR